MGEREEAAAAETMASAQPPAMRIFIGGVGPAVTAAEIERTFSSLGRVGGVELVRTNCRSFAYMDFEPTSEKSLAKLFSTYNGCAWKGGKLKLERAKEHYLNRLKREWKEDAEVMTEAPIDPIVEKDAGSLKLERLKQESMQLQIYFPKLRKVKALPFKGTGKHKYSFQRVEVPPLPIHFCDCEEHNEPAEKAMHKYLDCLKSGIHYDKELSIMNSVMNKLLKKESNKLAAGEDATLALDENVSDPPIDDMHKEEPEEMSETDDDTFVTNIGVGRMDDVLMHLRKETPSVNKVSRVDKDQSSKIELDKKNKHTNNKQKATPADSSEATTIKQPRSEMPLKITENEFTSILRRDTSSEVQSQEPEISSEPSSILTQSTKDQSWLQKSSWRNLVSGMGNSSFSITNIMPGISSLPPTQPPKSNHSAIYTSSEKRKPKAGRAGNKSKTMPVMQEPPLEKEQADDEMKEEHKEAEKVSKHKSRIDDINQASRVDKNQASQTELNQNMESTKKRKKSTPVDSTEATSIKQTHLESPTKISKNKFTSILPQNTISEANSQEPEASTEPSTNTTQSAKGQSWLQKSSWRDLVGNVESSSFSITNVLPSISSLAPTQPKSNSSIIETSDEEKKSKAWPDGIKSKSLGKEQVDNDTIAEHTEPEKTNEQKPRSIVEVGLNEVCTFMRCAESQKEWSKARAALSRHLNKKRKNTEDEDSPKSMKRAPPRKKFKN